MNFDHPECNGWIIVRPDQVDCDNPKNYHVTEVTINQNGESFRRNCDGVVMCSGERKLKKDELLRGKPTTDDSKIRSELTRLQNEGKEVCGVCMSRFFKDS